MSVLAQTEVAAGHTTPPLTFWPTAYGMVATGKPLHERHDDDYYPTPPALCAAALNLLFQDVSPPGRVLDVGCGRGEWGRAARAVWPNAQIVGVELNGRRLTDARNTGELAAYDQVLWADACRMPLPRHRLFDVVIGNPPYGQNALPNGAKPTKAQARALKQRDLAERLVWQALDLLRPGGVLLFMLSSAFTASKGRYERLYALPGPWKPYRVVQLAERPSFTGNGRTNATEYALFCWRKAFTRHTELAWLSWRSGDTEEEHTNHE